MPWQIVKRKDEYVVQKKNSDGTKEDVPGGKHGTLEDARAHMKALYASEGKRR